MTSIYRSHSVRDLLDWETGNDIPAPWPFPPLQMRPVPKCRCKDPTAAGSLASSPIRL